MIDREVVVKAYRLLLDRDPESNKSIEQKMTCKSTDILITELITSTEFATRNREQLRALFDE